MPELGGSGSGSLMRLRSGYLPEMQSFEGLSGAEGFTSRVTPSLTLQVSAGHCQEASVPLHREPP